MKKRGFFVLGILFIVVGAVLLLNSFSGITGLVVLEDIGRGASGFFGVVLILMGIGVLGSSTRKEKEGALELTLIDLAHDPKHENPDRDYKIVDANNDFGKRGAPLSLGELKAYLHSLHDPELVGYVRDVYGPALIDKAHHGSQQERKVAGAFYEVLTGKGLTEEEPNVSLSPIQREELKHAFRGYDGRITKQMREALRPYGLSISSGGERHNKILDDEGRDIATLSSSPSDQRTGINFVSNLVGAIEEHRKKKLKKT